MHRQSTVFILAFAALAVSGSAQTTMTNGNDGASNAAGFRAGSAASGNSILAQANGHAGVGEGTNPPTSADTLANSGGLPNSLALLGSISTVSSVGVSIWPGLVTLPDGNLLAIYMRGGGLAVNTSLSADHGATWQRPASLALPAGYNSLYASLTLLSNGKLFLAWSFENVSTHHGNPIYSVGTIGAGDAIRWGAPVSIPTGGQNYCWEPSPVVQLSSTKLLLPIWCYSNSTAEAPYTSGAVLSNDLGVTWSPFNVIGTPVSSTNGYDEGAAQAFPNGDVVMIMRHTSTDPYGAYARSVSHDGGMTWSPPVDVIRPKMIGRPSLLLLSSGQFILVGRVQLNGASTTGGAISMDEGASWTPISNIAVGGEVGDQYDALTLELDGSMGMVQAHGVNNSVVLSYSALTVNGVSLPRRINLH
jgi:hypothetical protein